MRCWLLISALLLCTVSGPLTALAGTQTVAESVAGSLSETPVRKGRCADHNALRNAYFGDLHVHTAYSQDASTQGTRNTPFDAYRFAKGEKLGLQPYSDTGEPSRFRQIDRPLDFMAVTDHAEQLGEVRICNTPGMDGYSSWVCLMYRWLPRAAFFVMNIKASEGDGERFGFCGEKGQWCLDAALGPWQEIQNAAEMYYDRSDACQFTTFVGYEWTGARNQANLHRNVIFRNAVVPVLPVSFIEANNAYLLMDGLERDCINRGNGCDALTIPHNSNLSNAEMFKIIRPDGEQMNRNDAERIARHQTLVEIMQHKGSSECYVGAFGAIAADELCDFEQLPYSTFEGKYFPGKAKTAGADAGFVREVLRDGLRQQHKLGANPFKMGFIGSTDTHMGTSGAVEENTFAGHGGAGVPANKEIPPGLTDNLEFNPGGLAVLWAEENSREALFKALRRREAYGTSGPRIQVRFFGGWNYAPDLCDQDDFVRQGYAQGVPMGGDLPSVTTLGQTPVFAVAAVQDAGTATSPGIGLQRIQIVKGWLDADGQSREAVFDVAGDANNGASVDLDTCQPQGKGAPQLCTVWRDPDFSAAQYAYYYARVVENPSCRWSQQVCVAHQVSCSDPATIGDGLEGCCSELHRPTIQERAWSSPIWYTPPSS